MKEGRISFARKRRVGGHFSEHGSRERLLWHDGPGGVIWSRQEMYGECLANVQEVVSESDAWYVRKCGSFVSKLFL